VIKITSADRYFSLCVRKRANWTCERCRVGYTPPTAALHCSHFMSRGNYGTRFDPLNAASLCYGCHMYFTGRPLEHLSWFAARVGLDEVERLKRSAKTPHYGIKKYLKVIGRHYRMEHDRMKLGGEFNVWPEDSSAAA